MGKAVGIGIPLLLVLTVSVYLMVTWSSKDVSGRPGHRIIKMSIALPDDLQEALRRAAAEDAPPYVKDKRFLPAIANFAGNLMSKGDSFDVGKLTDTIQQLGSMKNMAPDIVSDSLKQEAEVTGEVEKEVAEETIDRLLGQFDKKEQDGGDDDDDDGGGGEEQNEIKADINFVAEKGMIEDDMFAPAGMHMMVDIEENAEADNEDDDMTEATAFSFPMGMGTALMNGCFGTGYEPGDPYYNVKDVIPACYNMMEGCAYIGVGFDGRGDYSSLSRKKTVVQRNCVNMATYHDEDVPDNMNVHGIFDTEVNSLVFESKEAYRHSLQQKAGVSFSGFGFQAAVDSAWGGTQSSQSQSFLSLIECDIIRYEIFLDEVTPDTLSLAFMRDFLSLPKNFITGKAKLQMFIIRYGTHFIKSAKFGGALKIFKKQEASKTESVEEFAVQAQASYNSVFFNAGGHYGREESSESAQSSKTSSTHVMVEGGDQEVASIVADFYTTGFKDTFTEWLKSVPTYPKPIQMFMGTMSELLNLNYKLLFPFDISDAADGCFSENLKTEEGTGRKYYEVPKLVNNSQGEVKTVQEKRYCDVTSVDKFQEEMDKKRLALERAIAVYMEEGPVPTTDFHLKGGKPGCETQTLTVNGGKSGVTHPTWMELINGDTYKVIFDLPQDINLDIKRDTEAFLVYVTGENSWNCHVPGTSLHGYNSQANGGSGDTNNKKVSCFGFVMTYNEETGKFSVTADDQEASTQFLGEMPRSYVGWRVARAEYISPLEHSEWNSGALASILQAPCEVKWSNSYQINPAAEGGRCLYFVAASRGDIFVVFSAIPRDMTTWYHLQISYQGVALYKGMKLVKYEGATSARSLGDPKLFQPYFICLQEELTKHRTYIKYGIGSEDSEKGLIYMVYVDESAPLGIHFYSFGSGEADVEIMDARIIEGSATGAMECSGGTVEQNGLCVEDCHPECNGCIPKSPGSKLDTECRLCKHFAILTDEGSTRCVPECPANTKVGLDGMTCICILIDVDPDNADKTICVSECSDLKEPNDESPSARCVCTGMTVDDVCLENCPENSFPDGNKCITPVLVKGSPDMPYEQQLSRGLQAGDVIKIYGTFNSDAARGDIFLKCGSSDECIALLIKPWFAGPYTALNRKVNNAWQTEVQLRDNFPFARGAHFRLTIDITGERFRISANGNFLADYDIAVPISEVNNIKLASDFQPSLVYVGPPASDAVADKKWRTDSRCGANYPAAAASPGECDPEGPTPCCSPGGHCGASALYCTCTGCVDFRPKWREDHRCGRGFAALGANPAQCDPNSDKPCCSPWGWCGINWANCECDDCKDYRKD